MQFFRELLDALEATPHILRHKPSAVEVMDAFILGHTRLSPNLQRLRETFVEGEPGAILCIEFYADTKEDLPPRLAALEQDLTGREFGYRFYHATEAAQQACKLSLREAALGLSMTMKEDTKSYSFVEDTAVAPEKLRDFIQRFLHLMRKTRYAWRRVCSCLGWPRLYVRPVVNLENRRRRDADSGSHRE